VADRRSVVASEEEEVMENCERGRVQHPATHLEIVQLSDDGGRYTDRTRVCRDHFWSKRQYERVGEGTQEVHTVTRRAL